jgi:RsiW-degrading membrane proteinase PrsW (M82 family)
MSQNAIVAIGVITGMIPAIVWLFFWLQEDSEHKKPKGLLLQIFIIGMASVILIVPFEQIARDRYQDAPYMIVIWAFLEEVIKYGVVYLTVLRTSRHISHPVDYPIYFITAALGFAALENTLFLIHPLAISGASISFLTLSLRFLGANLLHSISSGLVGIALGLAFYRGWFKAKFYLFGGLAVATMLHSIFNFFITRNDGQNSFGVFGFLWIACIGTMMLFEKLRRMEIVSRLPNVPDTGELQ